MPFSCVKEKLGSVGWVLIPAAASSSIVFEGEGPPPNGCGSSITRTSNPWLAASSSARMTFLSVRIYISSQMDLCALRIALVITCSPSSGSTKTRTPCTPEPTAQLPLLVFSCLLSFTLNANTRGVARLHDRSRLRSLPLIGCRNHLHIEPHTHRL